MIIPRRVFYCFYYCKKKKKKRPEIINLKRGNVSILAHIFGGFSSWSVGPVTFGTIVKQPTLAKRCCRGAHSPYGSQEVKRVKGAAMEPTVPFEGMSSIGPTS
jgi:hypothetical protein